MFRNYIISAICASGLVAGAASAAVAVLPVAANAQFYISGSTALNNQLYADLLQAGGICAPVVAGTSAIVVYADTAVGGGGLAKAHNAAIVCNLNAALGTLAAGTPVAFIKESSGGSNEGTNNVANLIPLTFINGSAAPAGCVAAAAPAFPHQAAGVTEFDACTNTAAIIPQIGLADENPQLFNVGADAITPASIAKINTNVLFQNDFGIAVSLNAYRALQTQQGLGATDTLAAMPTLSSQQVAGLYTGAIDWSGVTSQAGVGLTPAATFLCRRGDTSGTNVSVDVFFLRNRCTAQRFPMLAASTTQANCGGTVLPETPTNFGCKWAAVNLADTTFAGTGGSDVQSCLHAHSQHGDFAIGALGVTAKFDDPLGAGGTADTVGSNQWRYVAIDGAKPNIVSHANGTYTYFMDNVINTLKTIAGNPAAAATFIQTSLTTAIPLSDTFAVQNAGDANYVTGGILDAAQGVPNAIPVTLAQVTANPVSPLTLEPIGLDDCQAPIAAASVRSVQAPAGN